MWIVDSMLKGINHIHVQLIMDCIWINLKAIFTFQARFVKLPKDVSQARFSDGWTRGTATTGSFSSIQNLTWLKYVVSPSPWLGSFPNAHISTAGCPE